MSKYRNGDWFAVPLREGGFACGVVARRSLRGPVTFGYFFGPRMDILLTAEDCAGRSAEDALAVWRFSDASLRDGEWPIVWHDANWTPEAWPMPGFCVASEFSGSASIVFYADDDPGRAIEQVETTTEDCMKLPRAEIVGVWPVEERLTAMLCGRHERQGGSVSVGRLPAARYFLLFREVDAAERAREALRESGLVVSSAAGDEQNAVVVVEHPGEISDGAEVEQMEARLQELAAAFGGEYDGLERRVV